MLSRRQDWIGSDLGWSRAETKSAFYHPPLFLSEKGVGIPTFVHYPFFFKEEQNGTMFVWSTYDNIMYSRAIIRACINVLIDLSKIKLCDWPNKLDATSWQVLDTTESVGMDRFQ